MQSNKNLHPGVTQYSSGEANSNHLTSQVWHNKRIKSKLNIGWFAFLTGFNGLFILPFLFPNDFFGGAISGTWRYVIFSLLCMFLGGFLKAGKMRNSSQFENRYYSWLWILSIWLGWMSIRSWIVGETLVSVLWNGLIYFTFIAVSLIGRDKTNWLVLNKLFVIHSFIGACYVFFVISQRGVYSRLGLLTLDNYSVLSSGLFYSAPFLLFSFDNQPKFGKITALFAYLATIIYAIIFQWRLGSIMVIVELVIFGLIVWRSLRLKSTARMKSLVRIIFSVAIIPFLVYSIFSLVKSNYLFQKGGELLYQRWTLEGNILDTFIADPRWEEAKIVSEQLTWDEWVVGRGIAATWSDPRMYWGMKRTMMHVGYFHYILQGGIILLFLMIVPLYRGFYAFWKSNNPITVAAAGCVLMYYIQISGYGFPTASLTWIFLGLALGRCIVSDSSP